MIRAFVLLAALLALSGAADAQFTIPPMVVTVGSGVCSPYAANGTAPYTINGTAPYTKAC